MPTETILFNQHIGVAKGKEQDIDPRTGNPEQVDVWTLVFTDRQSGNVIRITFRKDAKDEIVKLLSAGLVIADGSFPGI